MARTSNTLISTKNPPLTEFKVKLPLPNRNLTANVRLSKHWSVAHSAIEIAHMEAKNIFETRLRELGADPPKWRFYEEENHIIFYRNGSMDLNNVYFGLKNYLDALQVTISPKTAKRPAILGAGIVLNDSGCRKITITRAVNPYDFGVYLTIRPIEG